MRDLPSGTVTLLFTDIEGSTRLRHELGDACADAATAAAVERALGSDAMSSAWAEGRTLTLDGALALALAAVD